MGYNVSDVSGTFSGGLDEWMTTVDLSQKGVFVVSGDWDEVTLGGDNTGEAELGYTFSVLSGGAFGTLIATNTVDGTFSFEIDRAAVQATGSNQEVRIEVTGTNADGTVDDDVAIIELVICVEEGTMIATPEGERRVEDLAIGDPVRVLDGEAVPIRWIGSRRVSAEEVADAPTMGPIRLEADCFGPGCPSQTLCVSAQHRVLVRGPEVERLFGTFEVLAPAIGLVGLPGVTKEPPRAVTYYHVLFDQHQVMLTNGLATESFYPGEWSLASLGDAGRRALKTAVPHAMSPDTYGPSARPGLLVWEAQAIGAKEAAA